MNLTVLLSLALIAAFFCGVIVGKYLLRSV